MINCKYANSVWSASQWNDTTKVFDVHNLDNDEKQKLDVLKTAKITDAADTEEMTFISFNVNGVVFDGGVATAKHGVYNRRSKVFPYTQPPPFRF